MRNPPASSLESCEQVLDQFSQPIAGQVDFLEKVALLVVTEFL